MYSYGGSISGTSQENLVVFGGTVFQEILIWKIDNNYDVNEKMPVLHRLIGHKVGVTVLKSTSKNKNLIT